MAESRLYEIAHSLIFCATERILHPIGCNRGAAPESSFMHTEARHIVETPVEARAGFLDRPTLVVLIVSTTLMIGVFAVLYIGFFAR
jgi:hypothetical protein